MEVVHNFVQGQTDQPTDRPTDQRTKRPIEAPSRSVKTVLIYNSKLNNTKEWCAEYVQLKEETFSKDLSHYLSKLLLSFT